MKHKRLFASIMAVVASATILTACSNADKLILIDDSGAKKNVTEISFYGFKADDLDFIAMENILRGFMDEHEDIQICYEGVKGQPYWDAMELRQKSGRVDDVFMIDQTRVITMQDMLADLKSSVDLSLYNDLVIDQIKRADGSVRFMPMTLASYNLYVNYDLLHAHGFEAPQNYAEFAEICDYFKEQLKAEGLAPVICNQRRSLCSLIQGKSLFDVYYDAENQRTNPNAGAIIESYNQNPALLAAKLEEGIDFVQTLFDNGWVDPAATAATLQTSTDKKSNGDLYLFSLGKQPFAVTGGWAPLRLKSVLEANDKTMDFGVHPYPIMDDGCVLVMDVNNCVAVTDRTDEKDAARLAAAKKFAAHLTNPDSIWEFCEGQCCYSPLKGETRMPSEKSVWPTADYYKPNGRAVIGTNYQLNMTLDSYLMKVTDGMCKGDSAEVAKQKLTALLTGKGA